MSHITPQIQEAQKTPSKINVKQKQTTHWHHFKLQKIKDKEKFL